MTQELRSSGSPAAEPIRAIFEQGLSTYRKVLRENLMYHREAYAVLKGALLAEGRPFDFLDIACGDASASAGILRHLPIRGYCGIDQSAPVIEQARVSLKDLPCPVRLERGDFAEILAHWTDAIDVAWIGMSLHHLRPSGKRDVMRHIRRNMGDQSLFLIWEPTRLDDENRDQWMDRFMAELERRHILGDAEFAAVDAHIRAADFPETAARWKAMGLEAGFAAASELFMDPSRLGRIYRYRC